MNSRFVSACFALTALVMPVLGVMEGLHITPSSVTSGVGCVLILTLTLVVNKSVSTSWESAVSNK